MEGRRAFRGIEHAEATRCARADVEKTATGVEPLDNGVHGPGDICQLPLDRTRDLPVLRIDDAENFQGRQRIDRERGGVLLFGDQNEGCQALKELPQPQVDFTCGLLNLKPDPSSVST